MDYSIWLIVVAVVEEGMGQILREKVEAHRFELSEAFDAVYWSK